MSRRAWLWIAFVLVHLAVAASGFVWPTQPMGDLSIAYGPWARQALTGGGIPGIAADWVYPQLAIVPMVVVQTWADLFGGYEIAWAILVTLCDALAFALLIGSARSKGRVLAAWFWLAFAVALGPVGMYRIDALTVPLAIAGCLWLVGRPVLASALLAIGTWIKVWPAALLLTALIVVRRRLAVFTGAAVTTAVVLFGILALGGITHALGFVGGQTGRGLQLEAPVSAYLLWRVVFRMPDSAIVYDQALNTLQVQGPGAEVVSAVMTPLLFVVLAAVAALGAVKAVRGASFVRLFPPLALAVTLGFIVLNKVGSPQFQVWLIAPLVLALAIDRRRWRGFAVAALATALLTQFVYPLTYLGVMYAEPGPVAILTARNLLLVALFVWSVVELARVRRPSSIL
ncbi:glycosyltransferase family 87 protein [Microbacterium aoyamense]|uniref:glycosyltransferase family 87 protein n=1 Tax=Microbacterium aoyamense TaxID=344166 RepID=UPI0020059ED5|nr:glycosyltransferase family 87 protein [Microbacterium aoyamense]